MPTKTNKQKKKENEEHQNAKSPEHNKPTSKHFIERFCHLKIPSTKKKPDSKAKSRSA
jgi:hypothetical protein